MFNLFSFMKKYEIKEENITLMETIQELSEKISVLEEKYSSLLKDVVRLEEENTEANNLFYEIMNNIDAVDSRIDILTLEKWRDRNV